jgi:hypothetical protein
MALGLAGDVAVYRTLVRSLSKRKATALVDRGRALSLGWGMEKVNLAEKFAFITPIGVPKS